jgi:branched-chain amino acid transport system substrate-binding protein
MQKLCIENKKFLIIPTAAANTLTRDRCHPTTFRVSHSNWQMTHPMGDWLYKQGKRRIVTMGMDYAAGREMVGGFVEGFTAAGGQIIDQKWPGLTQLDYQAYFADVLSKNPDGVFTFFAGANAVEFVKQYAQSGLKDKVPLYGAAYLTDSTLIPAQGNAANGVITGSHWSPSLDNPANIAFMADFKKATGMEADLNSMHGHDTVVVMSMALEKTKGEVNDQAPLTAALRGVEFASPRGPFRFSCANNPVQNIYALDVKDQKLTTAGTAGTNVTDPTKDCKSCA